MANQLDTISFSTQSKVHLHNPSFDSHQRNKQNQSPQNFDVHQINREILFIADQALKLKKTTQTTSHNYKYIIRIAEISMKTKDVDNNKKLLDDIIDELSIIQSHSISSKTVEILLNRLIQLYKKKQSNINNSETNIKKFALFLNNKPKINILQKDSPRLHHNFQKSYSPTSQYQNSRIPQSREHLIQNQINNFEDPYNLSNQHFRAMLSPSINFQRQKNYYLSKY